MATSKAAELAAIISTNIAKLDAYNAANNLPSQSHAPGCLPKYPYPPEIEQARLNVIYANDELQTLIAGPIESFIVPYHNHNVVQQLVYKYKIQNSFKDKATYAEIADRIGLSEPETRRIIRTAMTFYIFTEIEPGVIGHTAISKCLADNDNLQHFVGMITEELWPAAAHYVQARLKWPHSQEPDEAGYQLAHDTEKTLFEFLASEGTGRAQRFANAMSLLNTGDGYEKSHLLENYDWAGLGEATLVDVGGSHGVVAASIVERFSNITAIVQDLPEVVAGATVSSNLEGRLSFRQHDFFKEQTIKADVYLMRWILHDWSDKYAMKIIRGLVPALKSGAKVIIYEYLVPPPGAVPKYLERSVRAFDLAMGAMANAKEREVQDWQKLFEEADSRFKMTYVKQPPLSKLGIAEFTFDG